jgi:hypothetical protein
MNPTEIRIALQKRYRTSINKALTATSPAERERWGADAAVAISELQHLALRTPKP